jgi:hypothetical protein
MVIDLNQENKNKVGGYTDEEIKQILYKKRDSRPFRFCLMFYGADGTGKTGLLQAYPLKEGEKHVILDLDGGNEPILETYHKDKFNQIIIHNPLETAVSSDGRKVIAFKKTMDKIKFVVDYVRRNWERDNIKAVSIDGLSKLLKYAEYQMRIEKHINAEGGVEYRYWKLRNQMFMEILEIMKSLPIDKFFVAHDDFIQTQGDTEIAKVKLETNRMMYQKVRCIRKDLPNKVEYSVIIDKSKYNAKVEGFEFVFLTVDKKTKQIEWKGQNIYPILQGMKVE